MQNRIDEAYAQLEAELRAYAHSFIEAEQKKAKLPHAIGFECVVGLGKSYAAAKLARELVERGYPVLVVTQNHLLASEYKANSGGVLHHHYGRVDSESDRAEELQDNVCFKMNAVMTAGARNHMPAASVCRTCPHGAQGVLVELDLKYGERKMSERDQKRAERALKTLEKAKKTQNLLHVEPCRFINLALKESLEAPGLVITAQSFSESFTVFGKNEEKRRRLIIVDEHIEHAKEIKITSGDVSVWRENIKEIINRHEKNEAAESEEMLAFLQKVDDVFGKLIAVLALSEAIDDDLRNEIIEIEKESRKIKASIASVARWEAISWTEDFLSIFAPLRALTALASSLKSKCERRQKNAILVYAINPIIEFAIKRGGAIFLDATMPLLLRTLIEKNGGVVYTKYVPQNIKVVKYEGGSIYARGRVGKKGYEDDCNAFVAELERIAQGFPQNTAIITHKARLLHCTRYDTQEQKNISEDEKLHHVLKEFEKRTGKKLGWYGKHDRGHNLFKGYNIVCVGMSLISSESYERLYAAERAAVLSLCEEIDEQEEWPEFDGTLTEDRVPLPRNDFVRNWLLEHYAATIVQAAGRARGARHEGEPLEIALFGGIDVEEKLRRFNMLITERRENTYHLKRGQKTTTASKEDILFAMFVTKWIKGKVSRRLVQEFLKKRGLTASTEAINDALKHAREKGLIPEAKRGRPKKSEVQRSEVQSDVAETQTSGNDASGNENSTETCATVEAAPMLTPPPTGTARAREACERPTPPRAAHVNGGRQEHRPPRGARLRNLVWKP